MDLGGEDLEQLGLEDGLDIPGEGKSETEALVSLIRGVGFETPLWNDSWSLGAAGSIDRHGPRSNGIPI